MCTVHSETTRFSKEKQNAEIHSSASLGQIQVLWGLKFIWGGSSLGKIAENNIYVQI